MACLFGAKPLFEPKSIYRQLGYKHISVNFLIKIPKFHFEFEDACCKLVVILFQPQFVHCIILRLATAPFTNMV